MSLLSRQWYKRLKLELNPTDVIASGMGGHSWIMLGDVRIEAQVGPNTIEHTLCVGDHAEQLLIGIHLVSDLGAWLIDLSSKIFRIQSLMDGTINSCPSRKIE